MRGSALFPLAFAIALTVGTAAKGQTVDEIRFALKDGYEREFKVAGCKGAKAACTINALALPTAADGADAICLESVFPDVVYTRDGQGALGVEYALSASTGPVGAYKFLGSYTAISVTETEGVQKFCVPRTLQIGGQNVAFKLEAKLPDNDQTRTRSDAAERGFRFALPERPAGARAAAQARAQARAATRPARQAQGAALFDRLRALPGDIVSSLVGETATGIVWVSIWSAKPGQPVRIAGRQIGQTAIVRVGMPKSSLKKLTIGQSATRLLSQACQVFQYGIEYQFRC